MTSKICFDTNILIYSIDIRDPDKHLVAERVVGACSDMASPVALQALGEFFSAVTRKGLLPSPEAAQIVNTLREASNVIPAIEDDLPAAIEIHQRYGFQFFDCLLAATYIRSGCTTLLSEDFQHTQTIFALTVLNPFRMTEQELGFLLQ